MIIFYYPLTASTCFGFQDQGDLVAGVGDELWNNGAECGKSLSVLCTGPTNPNVPTSCRGGNVIVKIVDHNPGAVTIINLSATAFALIVDPNAGSVYVDV